MSSICVMSTVMESRDFVSYVHKQFVQVRKYTRMYILMHDWNAQYLCTNVCNCAFFLPSKSSHFMFRPNECPSDLIRFTCFMFDVKG